MCCHQIKSNQTKPNQIKSIQIKPNKIKTNQTKPNLLSQNFEDCDVTQVILGQSSRQAK